MLLFEYISNCFNTLKMPRNKGLVVMQSSCALLSWNSIHEALYLCCWVLITTYHLKCHSRRFGTVLRCIKTKSKYATVLKFSAQFFILVSFCGNTNRNDNFSTVANCIISRSLFPSLVKINAPLPYPRTPQKPAQRRPRNFFCYANVSFGTRV